MKLEKFAPFIDFKPDTENVDDQESLGSCVAHAGQTALEIAFSRAGKPIDLSRMYLYYYVQQEAGTLGTTGGGWPTQLGSILANWGCAREAVWPYGDALLAVPPSALAGSDAKLNFPDGSTDFKKLEGLRGIKQALNRGQPVILTMYVHPGFVNLNGNNWREHDWDIEGMPVGVHATVLMGDSEADGRFLGENSWGPKWGGDGGFFGIKYEHIDNTKCVLEAYAFTRLPVPSIDVPGYQREDPATFDPATQLLTIPSIGYNSPDLGNGTLYGVTIKLKDPGKLTVNDPNWPGAEQAYFLPSVGGKRYLGLPKVSFQGQTYDNVVLVNPDFDLVSIEGV
jgi:hypothetical protein